VESIGTRDTGRLGTSGNHNLGRVLEELLGFGDRTLFYRCEWVGDSVNQAYCSGVGTVPRSGGHISAWDWVKGMLNCFIKARHTMGPIVGNYSGEEFVERGVIEEKAGGFDVGVGSVDLCIRNWVIERRIFEGIVILLYVAQGGGGS